MEWLGVSVGTGLLLSFVLESLKNASWFPWLNLKSSTLNRWVSVLMAFLATVGINYMWDEATRNLTIHIPTLGGFLLLLWQFGVQWAFQKAGYRAVVKEPQEVTLKAPVTTAKPAEAVF